MPILFSCCCDLPAKADVQGMCGHSGYYACNFCMHPGIQVPGEKKSVIRYIKGKNNYELRSHKKTIEIYKKKQAMPIQGLKRVSCMIAAKEFDLIYSFTIDYMHCALLGIMKKLLNLWLETKNHGKPYYIEKKNQIALSKRLIKIKPISEIVRKPRSIFYLEVILKRMNTAVYYITIYGLLLMAYCIQNMLNISGYFLLPFMHCQKMLSHWKTLKKRVFN